MAEETISTTAAEVKEVRAASTEPAAQQETVAASEPVVTEPAGQQETVNAEPAAAPSGPKVHLNLEAVKGSMTWRKGTITWKGLRVHISELVWNAANLVNAGEVNALATSYEGKDILDVMVHEQLMDRLVHLAIEHRQSEKTSGGNGDARAAQPKQLETGIATVQKQLADVQRALGNKAGKYDLAAQKNAFDGLTEELLDLQLAGKVTSETMEDLLVRADVLALEIEMAILDGMAKQIEERISRRQLVGSSVARVREAVAATIAAAKADPNKVGEAKDKIFKFFDTLDLVGQYQRNSNSIPRTKRGMTREESRGSRRPGRSFSNDD